MQHQNIWRENISVIFFQNWIWNWIWNWMLLQLSHGIYELKNLLYSPQVQLVSKKSFWRKYSFYRPVYHVNKGMSGYIHTYSMQKGLYCLRTLATTYFQIFSDITPHCYQIFLKEWIFNIPSIFYTHFLSLAQEHPREDNPDLYCWDETTG